MAVNKFNNIVFWLKNRCMRNSAMKMYEEALRNQSLPLEDLKKVCWEKRVRLVRYVYAHVPFYKQYYDEHGFDPVNLKTEADWNRIPPLEKRHIRLFSDRILNPDAAKKHITWTTTGGSTGTPLKVYRDKRFKLEILGWRAFTWWNVSPADNTGITHRRVPHGRKAMLLNRLLWWPTKRIYLSATSITEAEIRSFVNDINKKKIVWLTGYVGALEVIAEYILAHDITISTLRLVWSTSAPISRSTREKMEKAFGCKIMNQYGSCEVSNIAQQCPYSDHLHINADFVHVDIVDSYGNPMTNEEGDILVTDLSNYVFPLIRYRLGDRGCLIDEPCNCGISLPLMKGVKGRISDALYTPSGIYVDGNYLTTIFDDYSEYIDQFQVYQRKDFSITVLIKPKVSTPSDLNTILENILQTLKQNVKNEIPVKMKMVSKINHDQGKIRYIISEVALSKL